MRRRIFVGIVVSFILTTIGAYAQEWPSADTLVEKARTDLNLDQTQFDKVKVIIEDNLTKRKQIVSESGHGRITVSQSQDLDTEMYSKLSEVLTGSQMTIWNRILERIVEDMDAAALANSKMQPLPTN